jgi:hypothetical protein
MPRLTPGAATQAAARKVEESDKPVPQDADEAQQPARPPATKKPPARKPAASTNKTMASLKESAAKGPAAPPQRMRTSGLDESDDFVFLVLYGPAGTRKTTSSLRVTKVIPKGNILVIAAEAGMKRHALAGHGVDTSRIQYWPQRGEPLTFEGLELLFFQILADLEADPDSWACVSWDSLTEVIQTLVDNAVAADVARLTEIARVAKKNIEIRKTYERDGSDYQVVTGQFRQLLRKWRSLPCHQIMVALEENRQEAVETDDGRKVKMGVIGPALPPAVRMDVEQHADIIMRVSVTDVKGVGPVGIGRATPAEDLRAKDRYNVLPVTMVDPGWDRIWAYVSGELKEDNDTIQQVDGSASHAVESPTEKTTRQTTARKAASAARKAGATTAPKPSGRVTGDEAESPM